jgi:ABC-2 type transport system permease protein
MDGVALEAFGVAKAYGNRHALCGVELTARRGELHGLLGPNGAGKTTLMRVLLGLVRRDAGRVRLLGTPLEHAPRGLPDGVAGLVETPAFYPYLSGRRNLELLVQSSLPEDTLFGRSVKESGFAVSLVVLGFAALWILPAVTSIVGGDVFAAEDRHATWKTLLTRSRTRSEVFAGKVVTALAFATLSVAVLAVSSVAAGVLIIGPRPLIDLSGMLLSPSRALVRVALAWASVLPPTLGFTAIAILASVWTRSSAAGVGLPVAIALTMQLCALLDTPGLVHQLLITSAFGAWHGLLAQPPFYRPFVAATIVSAAYFVLALAVAHRLVVRRDMVT